MHACMHWQFRVWKMMKLRGLYLFCFLLLIVTVNFGDGSRLRQLSNNIIKSIKSQDGDVIDCVDIYHQPAFDHPLLQNHTIKMKPTLHPEGLFAQNKLSNVGSNGNKKPITQLWQSSGECPDGTIPVRRTEKQATSPKKKSHRNVIPGDDINASGESRHEYAVTETGQGNYNGAKATISVLWQPQVERDDEFSLSQIWVVGGSGQDVNTIEVGWTVDPEIFPDRNTRLFVYWTSDDYQLTGCYNLECPGFVQTINDMALGGTISSTDGNQPEISLLVWKDEQQNVWWLEYNGNIIGYWPSSLFTNLKGSASLVQWGGEIINSNVGGIHTATQMGSGSFAEAGLGGASYFRNLQVMDGSNALIPPADVQTIVTNQNCYNIAIDTNNEWGNYFYYGGPGKNPNCP